MGFEQRRSARRAGSGRPHLHETLERRVLLSAALLADVNTATADSRPDAMLDAGGTLYYAASRGDVGRELFKSDGTAAGTALVKDVVPGAISSFPDQLTATADGTVFFVANDPDTTSAGRELFKTDGTAAGTVMVRDIYPGPLGSDPHGLTAVGNTLYFIASSSRDARELWRSDGTEAGTVRVKSFQPGTNEDTLTEITPLGDGVVFASGGDDRSRQIWKSDGTEAGTVLLASGTPNYISPIELVAAGGRVYFELIDASVRSHLWMTDGTVAGTAAVPGVPVNSAGYSVYNFVRDGDSLLFAVRPDGHPYELWRTDGTAAGTVAVNTAAAGGSPAVVGDLVFSTYGLDELWRADGTAAGTFPVGRFPGVYHLPMVGAGDKLFFASDDPAAGTVTLHVTDGTIDGTQPLYTFVGSYAADFRMVPFRGGVALSASDAQHGRELWTSDGTLEGTAPVTDLDPRPAGSLTSPVPFPEYAARTAPVVLTDDAGAATRLVFTAFDAAHANGLWVTDGTPAGTAKLMSAGVPGTIVALASVGSRALFVTEQGPNSLKLWATDGTPAGTGPVSGAPNFKPERFDRIASDPDADSFTASGGYVYFSAASTQDANDYDLWRSDGTAAGTTLVKDLPSSSFSLTSPPRQITDVNGVVFFTVARDKSTGGNELWKTDGTTGGTLLVRKFDGSQGPAKVAQNLTRVGEEVFFTAKSNSATEVWRTDGTAAGTTTVGSFLTVGTLDALRPGEKPFAALGDRVLFAAGKDSFRDTDLWISDGTTSGTVVVKDIGPGGATPVPRDLRPAGDRVFFLARTEQLGAELWVTDGTAEGTHAVVDFAPGAASPTLTFLAAADGRLYFSGSPEGAVGVEPWVTDGTAAGTRLVQDVNPGAASSFPTRGATFGDEFVFWGDDGARGFEPWVAPHAPAAAGPRVVARRAFYNHSAFDGNDATAGAADDAAVAPGVLPLLPGDAQTLAGATTYSRGLNGVFIDVAALPGGAALTPDDFAFRRSAGAPAAWTAAAVPSSITVRRGAGVNGSDRVTLVWPDYDPANPNATAVANGWLEVTVKATERTGLASPDVFAFGNLIGDADASGRVNSLDLGAVKALLNTAAPIGSRVDFNRDGRVNALDLGIVKKYLNRTLAPAVLPPPPVPAPTPAPEGATALLLESKRIES